MKCHKGGGEMVSGGGRWGAVVELKQLKKKAEARFCQACRGDQGSLLVSGVKVVKG